MGWTLQSREIIKKCGCVKETKVHDDFPTVDEYIILCKECKDVKLKKEQEQEKEKHIQYDLFIKELENTEVKLVPRKEATSIMGKHNSGTNSYFKFRELINYKKNK